MDSDVVSEDVDEEEREVGKEERNERVDEDDEEKSGEDTSLREASAQRIGRGGVSVRVGDKKGAIRKKSTNPRDKITGCAHGDESSDKDVMRYSIKRLGDIKEKRGQGGGLRECERDVGDEAEEVVTGGKARAETGL